MTHTFGLRTITPLVARNQRTGLLKLYYNYFRMTTKKRSLTNTSSELILDASTSSGSELPAANESDALTYVSGDFRYVQPYWFDFRCHVKGRWVGRTAVEVCTSEFVAYPAEHYESAAESGDITVISREDPSGNTSAVNRVLKENDMLIHRALIREHPVPNDVIQTVFEDDNVLVVNKPAGWPVHPCGNYRINSIIRYLQANKGSATMNPEQYVSNKVLKRARPSDEPLYLPIHRLDRLTSGLLLIAKDTKTATEASKKIAAGDHSVEKLYLARVRGRIDKKITIQSDIVCLDHRASKYGATNVVLDLITEGSQKVSQGKWSATEFEPLHVGEEESIIICRPLTGRTHQIRVHLQALGHPITNDECYGGVWDDTHPYRFPRIPNTEDPNMHPNGHCSGIFLHAWSYKVPGLADVKTSIPQWAHNI